MEQRNSGAEQHRLDVEADLVNQICFKQRLGQHATAHYTNVFTLEEVVIGFDVDEMACEYAVSFGPNIEVIEPAALCEKVIAMTKATLEFYTIQ